MGPQNALLGPLTSVSRASQYHSFVGIGLGAGPLVSSSTPFASQLNKMAGG